MKLTALTPRAYRAAGLIGGRARGSVPGMARTKSAKKASRVADRRAVFNIRTKRTYKDSVKEIGALIAGKKAAEAEKMMPAVQAAVDKAVKTHVLQRNTAACIKSSLVKRIRAIA